MGAKVESAVLEPDVCSSHMDSQPGTKKQRDGKRKDHRGGRKSKKKQTANLVQYLTTAAEEDGSFGVIELSMPPSAIQVLQKKGKKKKKSGNRARQRTATEQCTVLLETALKSPAENVSVNTTSREGTDPSCAREAIDDTRAVNTVAEGTHPVADTRQYDISCTGTESTLAWGNRDSFTPPGESCFDGEKGDTVDHKQEPIASISSKDDKVDNPLDDGTEHVIQSHRWPRSPHEQTGSKDGRDECLEADSHLAKNVNSVDKEATGLGEIRLNHHNITPKVAASLESSSRRPLSPSNLIMPFRALSSQTDNAGTSQNCVEATSENPVTEAKIIKSAENLSYDVRPIPEKGMGMFATRPIARGSRIFSESPLMLLAMEESLFDVPLRFTRMSLKQQAAYLDLAATPAEERDKSRSEMLLMQQAFEPEQASDLPLDIQKHLLKIFETNSFAADTGSAIVAKASRMNHSCTPNVYHNWNTASGQLTVHAIRDLAAGEEILTCYVDVCVSRTIRQKELDRYGFKCDCTACCMETEFGRESEKRRRRLCALSSDVVARLLCPDSNRPYYDESTLGAVVEIIEIMQEERIENMELTRHYRMAADLSAGLGNLVLACKLAKLAVDLTEVCTGTDYAAYRMDEENLRELVRRRNDTVRAPRPRI